MIDDMIQDVYVAAEDANKAMQGDSKHLINAFHQQLETSKIDMETYLKNMHQHVPNTNPPMNPSTRFPHVRVDPTFRRSPNPFDTANTGVDTTFRQSPQHFDMASLPDITYHRSSHTFPHSRNEHSVPIALNTEQVHQATPIPHFVDMPPSSVHSKGDITGLPPLNHDHALKRAKVHFTGLGDMFVFYNQLLNGMEQFGIFLTPLNQVRYQMNPCPTHYKNIPLSDHRKHSMGNTLYQKLQDPDVIPLEHTAIRNIINRFAEKNNGYDVLYAMLELVHPALQKDAVILAPKFFECDDDIHLYAQKIDSWLRYETYANRPYSPREQVNLFIRELSSTFAPAVSQIWRLLDTWNPFDNIVPEPLKITSLPNTIEHYMMEEAGISPSHIRQINAKRHRRQTDKQGRMPDGPKKEVIDKFCNFCGMHGHISTNCDFMAKLLNANDSLNKVDGKLKKDLQDSFKQEQRKSRERRLKQKTNMIRKLLDTGGSREDIEHILQTIPSYSDDYIEDADKRHESDNSSYASASDSE
jgi:hypothetical protein